MGKSKNSSELSVSIVTRAFNEEEHIETLLQKIFEQDFDGRFEVVVVDSGSTDGTRDIVKKHTVKLIHIKPEEFSFGRSLNKGIAASSGEFLVFISAHCYPKNRHWLKNLLDPFKDKKVGLVYGKQRGNEQTKFSEHQIFQKMFPEESVGRQETPFCNNANCTIRRSLWEKIPYDEELTGLEDLDWAKKILRKGYLLSYSADAGVIHIHDESWPKIFRRYEREAIAFKRIFPDSRFSFLDFSREFLSHLISDYTALLRGGVKFKKLWEILLFRLAQFWGAYRGMSREKPILSNLREYFYYKEK